jgi:hypothetical protein
MTKKYKLSEVLSLIDKAEVAERKAGKDYPRAAGLRSYLTALLKIKDPKKVKSFTEEIDNYVKQGLGWTHEQKELEPAIEAFYSIAMEVRESIFIPIQAPNLDNTIQYFKSGVRKEIVVFKQIVRELIDFRRTLDTPNIYGLYEETQFPTPKQEANFLASRVKSLLKKAFFGSSKNDEIINDIKKDDLRIILKSPKVIT